MSTDQLNPSPFPFSDELNEDQDQHHHLFFSSNLEASSSSSLSCHMFYSSTDQDQSGHYHREIQHELQPQQEANNFGWHGGSYDLENESDNGLDLFLWKKEDRNENHNIENNNSGKRMSSKMRLMKKSDDQQTVIAHKLEDDEKQPISSSSSPTETTTDHNNNNININIPVRVCADCNTSKTPLWRSGPTGPKSLCNACGIRQRKARRAAMAAAAAANGTILATEASTMKTTSKVVMKNKRSNINGHVARRKKRSKFAIPSDHDHGRKKLCFEEFLISLSNNLAFQSVFPQDEKEAAILLMALSCGLVHG